MGIAFSRASQELLSNYQQGVWIDLGGSQARNHEHSQQSNRQRQQSDQRSQHQQGTRQQGAQQYQQRRQQEQSQYGQQDRFNQRQETQGQLPDDFYKQENVGQQGGLQHRQQSTAAANKISDLSDNELADRSPG
mgnify:CR=1 FL=1